MHLDEHRTISLLNPVLDMYLSVAGPAHGRFISPLKANYWDVSFRSDAAIPVDVTVVPYLFAPRAV